MKRYCKNIDITDINFIRNAIWDCFEGKFKRRDCIRLASKYTNLSRLKLKRVVMVSGKIAYVDIVDKLSLEIQHELTNKELNLLDIWYREKSDPSNFKVRRIGIQDIKQQIYDYIAVEGLRPLFARIGEFQCASIKGRGQLMGANIIKKMAKR